MEANVLAPKGFRCRFESACRASTASLDLSDSLRRKHRIARNHGGIGQEARRRIVTMAGGGEASRVSARSAGQRLEALRKANEIRVHRSQLKKDLAAGRVQIVDILAWPRALLTSSISTAGGIRRSSVKPRTGRTDLVRRTP